MAERYSKFTTETNKKIWEEYYGDSFMGKDPFGRKITKDNFVSDHIWPHGLQGSICLYNGIPLSEKSNIDKGKKISGIINGNKFEIKKLKMTFPACGDGHVGELFVNGKKISKY
jgi:hypothetical protein